MEMGYVLELFDVFLEGYHNKASRKAALSTLHHHLEAAPVTLSQQKAGQVLIHTAAAFISHHKRFFRPGTIQLSRIYRQRLHEGLALLYYKN